ncbi:MAG TPA: response regulator [Sneathiellales bacterium]|nr:response regulator [Sneathiellales bacterium]
MAQTLNRILSVEDDPDIQEVTRLSLENVGGFTVEVCSSGMEALRVAPVFKPDLILLDAIMPGMDGPETLQALRRLPEIETTPIVFMTAKVMRSEIERFKKLTTQDVISKPFDPLALPDKIREIWADQKPGYNLRGVSTASAN